MADQSRANNPNWRGGRSIASSGYVLVRVGRGHPLADVRGYAYEHRLVVYASLGRAPLPTEHVHHINGDKLDNRPENLEVLTRWRHRSEHRVKERTRPLQDPDGENPTTSCACGCGATFPRYDGQHRPRSFLPGHNTAQDLGGRLAPRRASPLDGRPALVGVPHAS